MIRNSDKASFVLTIIIAVLTLTVAGCGSAPVEDSKGRAVTVDNNYIEIEIKGRTFNLELALNDRQRARGLMGRDNIDEDGGMLFVMPPAEPFPAELTFWMKDCLVPIDVIFLASDGAITAIHEMEPPLPGTPDDELIRYSSNGPAQFVVELRGGMAAELDLEQGEYIIFPFEHLLDVAE
ncbi:MAG: DUF192 domain-containing protein [Bacillota bacterium]|nr:DUF192 domain-containing protein [Bacillota bacterium]